MRLQATVTVPTPTATLEASCIHSYRPASPASICSRHSGRDKAQSNGVTVLSTIVARAKVKSPAARAWRKRQREPQPARRALLPCVILPCTIEADLPGSPAWNPACRTKSMVPEKMATPLSKSVRRKSQLFGYWRAASSDR